MDESAEKPAAKKQRTQATLDGIVQKHEKPYSFKDALQQKLVQNVVKWCVEAMVPLNALANRSFDPPVKDIVLHLTVSTPVFC